MNTDNQSQEQELIRNINTNQVLLLKEKIQNLRNIYLRKKLMINKENFEKSTIINNINANLENLKLKNKDLFSNIENCTREIDNFNTKINMIKNHSQQLDGKITQNETSNSRLFEDINNKIGYLTSLQKSPQLLIDHILTFDKDVVNRIFINLHNINNEKNLATMIMFQKNMMNQMYYQNMNLVNQNNGSYHNLSQQVQKTNQQNASEDEIEADGGNIPMYGFSYPVNVYQQIYNNNNESKKNHDLINMRESNN